MWVLIIRAPRQDAAYWTGRRWLALLDAVAWPMLWAAAVIKAPFSTGLVGAVAVSLLVAIAARRSHKAIFRNERYWFTTWRWGPVLAGLAAVGALTKLMTWQDGSLHLGRGTCDGSSGPADRFWLARTIFDNHQNRPNGRSVPYSTQ